MPPVRPDFQVKRLGPAKIPSHLREAGRGKPGDCRFTGEGERVLYDAFLADLVARGTDPADWPSMERAGPRAEIYFDPSKVRAGVVTCGGLCPGLNDVVRGLVLGLHYLYGVRRIYGFRYGYEGFIPSFGHEVMDLTPEDVDDIHEQGGTFLASSRGEQDPAEIVDCLERMDISLLFPVGGDGTMRGALAIAKEIEKRKLNIAVVGVPKTIDNDIDFIETSFGFQTAYAEAVNVVRCAHVEAKGAPMGIGVVKLMGRHSGFIACHAALASSDVNFALIPEVPFDMDGPRGFLASLQQRLEKRRHALVVVAEGAGQHLFRTQSVRFDRSGNQRLEDIGVFLRDAVSAHFAQSGMPINLKYIDPSYIIRSVPARPVDAVYCNMLARHAVHAAMAGCTETLIGHWRGHYVHIPMATAISTCKRVDPASSLWRAVMESTGQPSMINDA
jgi:6-phosphofructokinase 1